MRHLRERWSKQLKGRREHCFIVPFQTMLHLMAMWSLLSLLIITPLPLVDAVIFTSVEELPHQRYDFVVIGGGTAGNVIANRLSENPDFSVLVLEAGVSNQDALLSEVPAFCGRATPNTMYDWNYTTSPQVGLNGQTLPYPRGFILGGSSSVNCMAYTRGSSDDFDRYAALTGDNGWSWDSLQEYMRKNEHFMLPQDGRNSSNEFDPKVHGFNGVNSVTLVSDLHEMDPLVFAATADLPDEFPFNLDTNSGNQIGMSWAQMTVKNGARSSSATSYLAEEFINRSNLDVLLHAFVTRVLPVQSNPLSFGEVEFTQDAAASLHKVSAKKEIIVSAGVIGTPHILMHSGIGDSDALSKLGIKPLLHLPSVGQNLTDQASSAISWLVNSTDTEDSANRNATLAALQLEMWNSSPRSGPLIDAPIREIAFLRVETQGTPFEHFPDPSAGPRTGHFELLMLNGLSFSPPVASGNFITVGTIVVSPASRGSITLNSNNPLEHPIIDPNVLGSDFDLFVLRESIRSARRFMASKGWDGYVLSSQLNATTDQELDAHFRATAGASYHAVGTASMSARESGWGVVDPDLRVKGVNGLRIVDASIFPRVPASHTQAPVYIIAERAADLIKTFWE
ncbi:aryl-alcohol-oxidase from pleurotus Eryingii [Mycena floridula]|nr:aryl-alcohol-oxidase from pleurotus Eryingii [Mycena floridula]